MTAGSPDGRKGKLYFDWLALSTKNPAGRNRAKPRKLTPVAAGNRPGGAFRSGTGEQNLVCHLLANRELLPIVRTHSRSLLVRWDPAYQR